MRNLLLTIVLGLFWIQIHAQNGHNVDVNGISLYYEIHGEGAPLVLLHGNTSTHHNWIMFIEEFSKNFQLIIPDLRGHGQSTNPTGEFNHKLTAMDIYGLMDHLQIDKFKAIGFSSGAFTLTHMAVMDKTRIESMIIMASTTYFPESAKEVMRSISYETVSKETEYMNYLKTVHPGGEEQIRSVIENFSNLADKNEMHFTNEELATIQAKTLIIHGDRDEFFPVDIPLNTYNSIPNSFLWIMPNQGHYMPRKGSSLYFSFMDIATKFLTDNWWN